MRFNDLASWLNWLETLHPKAIDLGLERVGEVARVLEVMAFSCPVITVTGTNGKGSCVALLEAVLRAAGYRTGVYTSPHLLTYNERVRINGVAVDDRALCEAFAIVDQARGQISLTYFEFGTLAAFYLFKQANLDVLILEVGMGGRLDAVNIVDADVAIITTIALDHTEWLGPDRETIGKEKAGIMRTGKPVICGDFSVPESIRAHAKQLNAPLYCQSKEFGYEDENTSHSWLWWSTTQRLSHLTLPKIALQNAATALQALMLLTEKLSVTRAAIEKGLAEVFLPGRFQVITTSSGQRILDVAHNPAAAQMFAAQLQDQPNEGRTLAVIAMLSDKDYAGTVKPLLGQVDAWYVAGLAVARGGSADLLANCLQGLGAKAVFEYATVTQAYEAALGEVNPEDRIIVFGSFYTVAEIVKRGI